MPITLPVHLEQALAQEAEKRNKSVESVLEEAIVWYLAPDPLLEAELKGWQDLGLEAWEKVEGMLEKEEP